MKSIPRSLLDGIKNVIKHNLIVYYSRSSLLPRQQKRNKLSQNKDQAPWKRKLRISFCFFVATENFCKASLAHTIRGTKAALHFCLGTQLCLHRLKLFLRASKLFFFIKTLIKTLLKFKICRKVAESSDETGRRLQFTSSSQCFLKLKERSRSDWNDSRPYRSSTLSTMNFSLHTQLTRGPQFTKEVLNYIYQQFFFLPFSGPSRSKGKQ